MTWPLVAALIGSATALLIAFVAYPWQKAKDRELQIGQEARNAAQEFLKAVQQGFFDISRKGEMRPEVADALNQSLHNLHFYFEKAEVLVARQYVAEHLKLARLLHEKRDADDATVSFEASDAAAESFVELIVPSRMIT